MNIRNIIESAVMAWLMSFALQQKATATIVDNFESTHTSIASDSTKTVSQDSLQNMQKRYDNAIKYPVADFKKSDTLVREFDTLRMLFVHMDTSMYDLTQTLSWKDKEAADHVYKLFLLDMEITYIRWEQILKSKMLSDRTSIRSLINVLTTYDTSLWTFEDFLQFCEEKDRNGLTIYDRLKNIKKAYVLTLMIRKIF